MKDIAKRPEWVRESSTWQKDGVVHNAYVCLDAPEHDFEHDTWFCTYWIIGFGGGERFDIIGANAVQAISLALQQIKNRLVMLVEDGYTMCEKDENDVPTKIYTKRETIKNLNAVYGLGVIGDKAHTEEWCLQAIERLQEATGTEEEQDRDIDFLRDNLADPKIIDYIFHHQPELSAEDILAKALAYRPLLL